MCMLMHNYMEFCWKRQASWGNLRAEGVGRDGASPRHSLRTITQERPRACRSRGGIALTLKARRVVWVAHGCAAQKFLDRTEDDAGEESPSQDTEPYIRSGARGHHPCRTATTSSCLAAEVGMGISMPISSSPRIYKTRNGLLVVEME